MVECDRTSNSIKPLWLSLLPAKIKKDPLKNLGDRVVTAFSHCKSMGIFQTRKGCSLCSLWSNFELIQAFMGFLLTCKNAEDPIKNKGANYTFIFVMLKGS